MHNGDNYEFKFYSRRPAPVLEELDITILNGTWCYQKLDGLYEDEINICYEASLAGSCNVSIIQLLGH